MYQNTEKPLVQKLPSEKDTVAWGRAIGHFLVGGEVVALKGELGSGKTTFVRGIASGAGISPDVVSSPTFLFIQEYHGRVVLAHADLYRVECVEDLSTIGLNDYFDGRRVVVIEWAERAGSQLPPDHLSILFEHGRGHTRKATFQSHGPQSRILLAQVVERMS